MVGAIPHEIMGCYILYIKGKDDIRICTCSTPKAI